MHNVFRFIFSHGRINWKAFNAAFEDFSLSWSFCPAKCWYRESNKKKKIRLWSTLFSSSTSKMIHVIEKKILPPFEERSMEKESKLIKRPLSDKTTKLQTFGLTMTCMDYLFFSFNASSTKIRSSSFQHEFPHPRSDKVLSTRAVISQHSNRRFRHQTLHLHHQRRQFYKQEEEWFQNFSAVKRIFEHDRQHVNNVTRVAISESEDFER